MASGLPVLLLVLISPTMAQAGLRVFDMRARGLISDFVGPPDTYVRVYYGSSHIGTTSTQLDDPNPWWGERFYHFGAQQYGNLELRVYDKDVIFDDLMGTCRVQIRRGTHERSCYMDQGGTVYFSYTLS